MASRSSVLVALAASLWLGPASAQTAADKAAADALAAHGQKLMAANQVAAACQKFEASVKLNPALDTMLDLADCFEKVGRTASAWAAFREAANAARSAASRDREEAARARAASLESRLSTINVTTLGGVEVSWDGKRVDDAMLGTPIPVDPGKHFIEAGAPGKKAWTKVVEVLRDRTRVEVDIPDLQPLPASAASEAASSAGPKSDGSSAVPGASDGASRKPPFNNGNGQRILAAGVGVAGLAGAGLAVILAARASSAWNEARSHCSPYPDRCDHEAVRLSQDAREAGNMATIATLLGAAGLVGGAVLWFTAPRPRTPTGESPGHGQEPSWTVGVASNQLLVRGAF